MVAKNENYQWEDASGFLPFKNIEEVGQAVFGYYIKNGNFKYKDGSQGTKLIFSEDDKGEKMFCFGANALLVHIFKNVQPGSFVQITFEGPSKFKNKAGKTITGKAYKVQIAKNVKVIDVSKFGEEKL